MSRPDEHYLLIYWTEENGAGTFSERLDYQISHPPECEPVESDEGCWSYECWIQHELDNIGVDAFCFERNKVPQLPCCVAVEAFCYKGWAKDDVVTGIRPVPEETL